MPDLTLIRKALFFNFVLFANTLLPAQSQWVEKFYNIHNTKSNSFLKKTPMDDAYMFMRLSNYLDALHAIFLVTEDTAMLNEQKRIVDGIIASAHNVDENQNSNNNEPYLGWKSRTVNKSYNEESALYESYLFQYILKMLFDLKESGWVEKNDANTSWYNNVVHFTEKNVWEKWTKKSTKKYRQPYAIFLGKRTHMAAHWAGIALLLSNITTNNKIKNECIAVYTTYDTLLKRNLRYAPSALNAYIWNSTWDNVEGTQAIKDSSALIQDVSHGNHVLSYIIIAKSLHNPNWSDKDIQSFCNTIIHITYDKEKNIFNDNVDGTRSSKRAGWGNFQSDGWLKAGRYNDSAQAIYTKFALQQNKLLKKYGQEFQYYANLALNEYLVKNNIK